MTDSEIANFHVKVSGEVDTSFSGNVEKELTKGTKSATSKLQKQLEEIFKSNKFGEFLEKNLDLSTKISKTFGGGGTKSTTKTNETGESGIMSLLTKLGVLVGATMLVVNALKSLAPIQAILKMITTVLQLTLYPIANVLLNIIKPIMMLLLKYVIMPFMSIMGIGAQSKMSPEAEERVKGYKEDWWGEFLKELGIEDFKWPDWGKIFSNWLKDFPILNWASFLSPLSWALFVSDLFWNTFIPKITWDNFIKLLEWASFLSPLTWITFVSSLFWDTFIPNLVWPDIFGMLTKWVDNLSKIKWPDIIGMLTKWVNGLSTIQWPNIAGMLTTWVSTLATIKWPSLSDIEKWIKEKISGEPSGGGSGTGGGGGGGRGDEGVSHTLRVDTEGVTEAGRYNAYIDDAKVAGNNLQAMLYKYLEQQGVTTGAVQQAFEKLGSNVEYKTPAGTSTSTPKPLEKDYLEVTATKFQRYNKYNPNLAQFFVEYLDFAGNLQSTLSGSGVPKDASPEEIIRITKQVSNWDKVLYKGQFLAQGGIVTHPTNAIIGEAGPEAVIPLRKFSDMKLGGNNPINVTFNIARIEKEVDINDIISKIERTLYTNLKRAGN